jgi:hypothetical protein
MEIVTADLSKFGLIEIDEAIRLLTAYREQSDRQGGSLNLGDGITLNFNSNSGYVFLSDEDYNVFMMNGDLLEEWFNCSYCGHEGFKEDMYHEPKDKDCTEYLESIGVKEIDSFSEEHGEKDDN